MVTNAAHTKLRRRVYENCLVSVRPFHLSPTTAARGGFAAEGRRYGVIGTWCICR